MEDKMNQKKDIKQILIMIILIVISVSIVLIFATHNYDDRKQKSCREALGNRLDELKYDADDIITERGYVTSNEAFMFLQNRDLAILNYIDCND